MATFDVVFEGGGVKGLAFLGALEVLAGSGHSTRRLVGTSAGAITATCLAVGYSPQEMMKVAQQRRADGKLRLASILEPPRASDFPKETIDNSELIKILESSLDRGLQRSRSRLLRKNLGPSLIKPLSRELAELIIEGLLHNRRFVQVYCLVEDGALYRDQGFLTWMKEQITGKGFPEAVTFRQLHKATGKDLSLVAADTTDKEVLVLNHRTAPDCPVLAAVRMSMSIPFIWEEVSWKKEWGEYRRKPKTGNYVVDGGVLSNFALRLLVDETSADIREMMGKADREGVRVLGLLLDEQKPAPGAEAWNRAPEPKITERTSRLIETVTGVWDREVIAQHRKHICPIGAKGFGMLEFDMSPERLEVLFNSGRCAMTEYLKAQGLEIK